MPPSQPAGPPTSVCVPTVDGPSELYEACTVDADACSDSCAGLTGCHSLFGHDPVCPNMCGGAMDCPEGQICQSCGSCTVGLCLQSCDPLDPVCPETLPTCTLRSGGFVCMPMIPAGGLGVGEDCSGATTDTCMDDLLCINAEVSGPKCSVSCCSDLCDATDPGATCTDPAHVCQPFFPEEPPPGQEHVGVCALLGSSG